VSHLLPPPLPPQHGHHPDGQAHAGRGPRAPPEGARRRRPRRRPDVAARDVAEEGALRLGRLRGRPAGLGLLRVRVRLRLRVRLRVRARVGYPCPAPTPTPRRGLLARAKGGELGAWRRPHGERLEARHVALQGRHVAQPVPRAVLGVHTVGVTHRRSKTGVRPEARSVTARWPICRRWRGEGVLASPGLHRAGPLAAQRANGRASSRPPALRSPDRVRPSEPSFHSTE